MVSEESRLLIEENRSFQDWRADVIERTNHRAVKSKPYVSEWSWETAWSLLAIAAIAVWIGGIIFIVLVLSPSTIIVSLTLALAIAAGCACIALSAYILVSSNMVLGSSALSKDIPSGDHVLNLSSSFICSNLLDSLEAEYVKEMASSTDPIHPPIQNVVVSPDVVDDFGWSGLEFVFKFSGNCLSSGHLRISAPFWTHWRLPSFAERYGFTLESESSWIYLPLPWKIYNYSRVTNSREVA